MYNKTAEAAFFKNPFKLEGPVDSSIVETTVMHYGEASVDMPPMTVPVAVPPIVENVKVLPPVIIEFLEAQRKIKIPEVTCARSSKWSHLSSRRSLSPDNIVFAPMPLLQLSHPLLF